MLLATANLLSADNLEGSALTQSQALEFSMSGGTMHEKWVGQDYYNPFLRTGVDLNHPSEGLFMHVMWLYLYIYMYIYIYIYIRLKPLEIYSHAHFYYY